MHVTDHDLAELRRRLESVVYFRDPEPLTRADAVVMLDMLGELERYRALLRRVTRPEPRP